MHFLVLEDKILENPEVFINFVQVMNFDFEGIVVNVSMS